MRTHYQTLKVAEDAPPEVIKAAYRVLSQQNHPDSNAADQQQEAVGAMQAINAAYEVLIDPAGRSAYDESLRVERAATADAAGPASSALVVPAPEDAPIGEHRRRRRHSSSRSHSRSADSALARLPSEPLYRSSSGSHSLTKRDRSIAPMFRSAQSTHIHGRRLSQADAEERAGGRGGEARPRSGRGMRLAWVALIGLLMGLLLLGGLVAWRLGLAGRLWAWYHRQQAAEASRSLRYGTALDMIPPPSGMDERPYTRPRLTPQGHPWPTSTGYLQGAPLLWDDGHCQIIVDNILHDSDVHAKIVAISPADDTGAATKGPGTIVREAYVQRGTRMHFETLRPGTYELRYRSLLTGLIVRAAVVELTQASEVAASGPAITTGSAEGSSIMISLYKVAPGNVQRPVLDEAAF